MASNEAMITAAQIRAARGLLDWSRKELAEAAGCGHSTIADYESGRTDMLSGNMRKVIEAFDRHGVVFIGTLGVSFKEGRHNG